MSRHEQVWMPGSVLKRACSGHWERRPKRRDPRYCNEAKRSHDRGPGSLRMANFIWSRGWSALSSEIRDVNILHLTGGMGSILGATLDSFTSNAAASSAAGEMK